MGGGFAGIQGGGFHGGFDRGGGFREGGHDRGFHDRDFGRRFFGGGSYPYYDNYAYDDYYDNGSCYVVQRRVHTTHGWRVQPVQVCS
jgi:hypothetical protein